MPRRREPIWLERLMLDAVHLDLVRSFGGLLGVRDENTLESALARPRHRWAYARQVDLAALAASYAFGIARNHPYQDGNKRLAFLAMMIFLGLNGHDLDATEADVVTVMLRLAAGDISEPALAKWIRGHLTASQDS